MKEQTIESTKAILLRSGVSAFLPDEVKDQVCQSVANDLWDFYLALFRQRIEQMQVLSYEEMKAVQHYGLLNAPAPILHVEKIAQAQLSKCREDALKELE